ncbi:MAG TPA: hypothetical protein VN924_24560 [Bryobacteraceae bacterium]|jgi:hypothetical protein|nr:hypothetical protein [Bryobacteraceae bacterium]
MHQYDLTARRTVGPYGFDKHLHIRLRMVQLFFNWPPPPAGRPGPQVPGDGLHVRILE